MLSCIVCHKASDLCGKLERVKAYVIFRWLKSHSLQYCIGIYETQRSPVKSAEDALDLMQHIHPKVSEQNHDSTFIINMD